MEEWTAKAGCTLSPEESPNFEMGSDAATVKAAVLKLKNDGDAAVNVLIAGNYDVTEIMIAATELVTKIFMSFVCCRLQNVDVHDWL